ncbi:MAG: metal-dependent hydrolase [Candidatus Methanoperedens sp.]|nr:metal-dependent hydrolase [Candidatus Methanoperedens sp.]
MSSPLDHIFFPVAILLLFSKKLKLNPREVIALSFFAILPDIDVIFFGSNSISFHRVLFHNIFIVIIPLSFSILVKSYREVFGIICFYLTSHLILDMFTGGIFLFYPVYHDVFFARAELLLSHGSFVTTLEYGISNKIMNNGIGEPAISSENIAVALLLIICAAISVIVIHGKTE